MNEKVDFREMILKKVLPKRVDTSKLKVEVKVNKPIININILDENGRVLFWGMSKCSPEDKFDVFIGTMIAIARLKMNVNEHLPKHDKCECGKKKFVPELGQKYWYFCTASELDGNNLTFYAEKVTWNGSELDYLRLGRGNVFATERDARKEARRKYFEGRIIAKEARKNG